MLASPTSSFPQWAVTVQALLRQRGEMLIKQPGSYRKFSSLTLGGYPGLLPALQGELWLWSEQAWRKESVGGCELTED